MQTLRLSLKEVTVFLIMRAGGISGWVAGIDSDSQTSQKLTMNSTEKLFEQRLHFLLTQLV